MTNNVEPMIARPSAIVPSMEHLPKGNHVGTPNGPPFMGQPMANHFGQPNPTPFMAQPVASHYGPHVPIGGPGHHPTVVGN